MTFGKNVINFYNGLKAPKDLPGGVEVLFPFESKSVKEAISIFNERFFNDSNPRTFLIGINPGRLGGGVSGIPFTDPIRLETTLGLPNSFDKKQELSSNFIYQMIDHLGGPKSFYSKFYFTSVSPVGFMKEGKNLNYYDIPELEKALESYMVSHFREQIGFGANKVAYSLGQGKNIVFLNKLNAKYKLFEEIKPLPHPRWVMQYRLKKLSQFLDLYKSELLT